MVRLLENRTWDGGRRASVHGNGKMSRAEGVGSEGYGVGRFLMGKKTPGQPQISRSGDPAEIRLFTTVFEKRAKPLDTRRNREAGGLSRVDAVCYPRRGSSPPAQGSQAQKVPRVFIGRRGAHPIQAELPSRFPFAGAPSCASATLDPLSARPHQKKPAIKKNQPPSFRRSPLPSSPSLSGPPSPDKSLSKLTNRDIGLGPLSRYPSGNHPRFGRKSPDKTPLLEGTRQRAAIEARLTSAEPVPCLALSAPTLRYIDAFICPLAPGLGRGWGALWDEDMSPCVPGLDRPGAVERCSWVLRWWDGRARRLVLGAYGFCEDLSSR